MPGLWDLRYGIVKGDMKGFGKTLPERVRVP